jgi:lipoprotein-releasing system permease protein
MPVQLQVFLPNRNASAQQILNKSEDALNTDKVLPVGIFSTKTAEIDQRYIITPLAFIQQLADRGNRISSIEINLKNENRMLVIQEQLATALGDDFIVKNCFEQQELLYKIVNTERLATFLIIAFIMIIAAFNIIGALSMLMLDKQKDITALRSLGCTVQDIQSIFFRKSMLTILLGIGTGLFIGLGLAFLQQTFGFIGMGSGIYPVTVVFTDIILVSLSVFSVGLLVSWYPAKVLSSKLFKN